ncbi:MAG: FMN-binding glutamate synthase family protein [Gammaproteobacteria bacterium]|nr:FMN-binding glutamate synthase family protein [uncultured Shewanella sp.]MBU1392034.1 FMN-binding glutamate synthase family protein [Gammaproteobacteria bacterium]MBU1476730.1 FMN-binding glutamate synthase family protein [Gammaproteobacteria bacterium]MBU1999898.1 FMN-binding glutamate synthase family protein [Gammaproteobacteria bacterium]MBU2133710.1 FMN-binding glutamate synthase family protein [Gammaproteobacteria bacterium]MBU2187813.1 FMN-binding glutamate synthase family protein [Ga
MSELNWFMWGLDLFSGLFLIVIGFAVLAVIYMYIADKMQTKQAVRHNYPVIGRFRYLFEKQGEFFRQYFFAQDREELPFNRAERSWVYRAAKNVDRTIAFGSTRPLDTAGTIMFMNTAFPTQDEDITPIHPLTIGTHCRQPYTTQAICHISAMSFGALSRPAITALSHGAAQAGCWLNTGEGGLSPYHLKGGCDLVFQIGTAKYGVRNEQGHLDDEKLKAIAIHPEVKMFEIKMSQGAKPGKGGILPGIKVNAEIAHIRGIPEGHDSISPNGHIEFKSVNDILDMIERVREVTGKPTGIKAVLGDVQWLEDLCDEIERRGEDSAPDFFTLDSADGGTGAAPQPLMDYVGLPLKESLPILVNILIQRGFRKRIKVIASGKLIVPSRVAWALALGADFIASARGNMFALGCIQALQCNKDTCPTGITTHNPKLQQGLNPRDKSTRVANYNHNLHHDLGLIAHSCGVTEPRQLKPSHVRIVLDSGLSISLDKFYSHMDK